MDKNLYFSKATGQLRICMHGDCWPKNNAVYKLRTVPMRLLLDRGVKLLN